MANVCFAGNLGQGKTYTMMERTVEQKRKNPALQIYSNMAGLRCPEAIYYEDIEQVQHISHGLVQLDEAAIVVPAQYWQEAGRDFITRCNQMRKVGLDLYYTAQRGVEGVNTNLRAVTSEIVNCQRVGAFVTLRSGDPKEKKHRMGMPRRMRRSIYALYNTLEVISSHGGSIGTVDAVAMNTVAIRREAAERDRIRAAVDAGPPRGGGLLRERWWSGWWGENPVLYLREDAAAALSWLKAHGYYDPAEYWRGQVVRELARRAWLETWGLAPDDAPVTCTPENPWLPGYDPATVKREWQEVLNDRAAAKIKVKTTALSGRTYNG